MAVKEVNKENFKKEVKENNKLVLVDFNADWCGPCRMLRPILEEISQENKDVKIVSVNIDDEEELSLEYGISSIPCLVLFDKGSEIKRSIGLISKDEINDLIGGK